MSRAVNGVCVAPRLYMTASHCLVVEARSDARLPQEALTETLVARQLRREELQRDTTSVRWVLGDVNRTHGALADH
jgi:hypothetical protein